MNLFLTYNFLIMSNRHFKYVTKYKKVQDNIHSTIQCLFSMFMFPEKSLISKAHVLPLNLPQNFGTKNNPSIFKLSLISKASRIRIKSYLSTVICNNFIHAFFLLWTTRLKKYITCKTYIHKVLAEVTNRLIRTETHNWAMFW